MVATNPPGLMDLLIRKMTYLNQAQTVHAENVANSNTPGYKAREIIPFNFESMLKDANVGMAVTDPRHIIPASLTGANAVAVREKPNGPHDAEDIEQESMQVSKVGLDYQLVTSIYHKMTGLFRIALKGS